MNANASFSPGVVLTEREILARVLHRDGMMLVIDKPAGIAVHQGPKGGRSLEDSFGALRFGLPRNPALAHRLDRETSGCLILGRHRKALIGLGKLFKQGRIDKLYWAVVQGAPQDEEGLIDLPLGKLDASRGWRMQPDALGRPSQTHWRVLGRADQSECGPLAWLALKPLTGRTHQIRVHCASQGWPVLGDTVYGRGKIGDGVALHLHARSVVVPLSVNREPVCVTARAPLHMLESLHRCGWSEERQSDCDPTRP